jgi:hypothetical protein
MARIPRDPSKGPEKLDQSAVVHAALTAESTGLLERWHSATSKQAPNAELTSLLRAAAEAKPELSEATESLNRGFIAFEEALRELNMGIRGQTTLWDPDPDDNYPTAENLVWGKDEGVWSLLVEEYVVGTGETVGTKPLLKCNRDDRKRAVRVLPDLLRALAARARDEAVTLREHAAELATLTNAVREAKP